MRPNEILSKVSESLINDESILGASERSLLRALLQNLQAGLERNPSLKAEAEKIVAGAVGETIAQRAYAVLGMGIVERILADSADSRLPDINLRPQPPSPGPPGVVRPPVKPVPEKPHPAPHEQPQKDEPMGPHPTPGPPGKGMLPQKPAISMSRAQGKAVGILQRPQCLALDEFLAPQELRALFDFTLAHETEFRVSEVVSPAGGIVDYEYRRSRVLLELGAYQEIIMRRIKSVLPEVCEQLGMDWFDPSYVEAQITASNDGDCFKIHTDNGQSEIASRYLTFVYFFHKEPAAFQGGELRLYDEHPQQVSGIESRPAHVIVPQVNRIVFFPCSVLHEITAVKCASRAFADSRFTLNGWLHR